MRIKLTTGMLVASALLSFACSSEPKGASGDGKGEPEAETGELSLRLVGVDSAGVSYRLRDAVFEITSAYYPGAGGNPGYGGAVSTGGAAGGSDDGNGGTLTVSSETDPDSSTIHTRVLPGTYYVTLQQPGWSLERVTPAGTEPVEQAVLLSDATQYAYVYDRSTTEVNYRFGVDGTLIDFRYGDIDIGISIERPGDPQGYGGATGGAWGTGGFVGADGGVAAGGVGTGGSTGL